MKKAIFYLIISTVFCESLQLSANEKKIERSTCHSKEWLPVIAICTSLKIKKKKEYKTRYRVFYQFKEEQIKDTYCSTRNTEHWKTLYLKRRGNSSDYFRKKQYLLKFLDPITRDSIKVSLGGFSKASKWVLNAPYVDKSSIRNIFSYNLGKKLGLSRGEKYFAPNTKPFEVFINSDYQGIYILTEKISRGKQRVNIPKLKKQNKDSLSFIAEISANDGDYRTPKGTYINHVYPSLSKLEKISAKNIIQSKYYKDSIRKEIDKFESLLKNDEFLTKTLLDKKQNIIDTMSFVDYFLLQEIFKNVDGLRRSAFFHRKQNGKISMGPLWDFNLAIGNLSYYGMHKTSSWLYKKRHSSIKHAFWFKALINNETFRNLMISRYFELRSPLNMLSIDSLFSLIDQNVFSLRGGFHRDHKRWRHTRNFVEGGFLSTWKKGKTPEDHIIILKEWLQKRILWIDSNINNIHH